MLLKIVKMSFVYVLFSFFGLNAYAETYRLLVDNNTEQPFYVDSMGNSYLKELESGAKDKVYLVEWQTNSQGSTVFVVRFFSANQSYYPIMVVGLKNVEEPKQLRCWSKLYKCSVQLHHSGEGKLIINSPN